MVRVRKAFYTKMELRDEVLGIEDKQQHLFIPNEIFSDLVEAFNEEVEEGEKAKGSSHISFAYAYHYLANYMWRYAKYYTHGKGYHLEGGNQPINEKMLKRILGFAKGEQFNYITKNKGLLCEMDYIKKVTDKPYEYLYEEEWLTPQQVKTKKKPKKETYFRMESETYVTENHKSWKANMPVKMYNRWNEEDEADMTGILDDISSTHNIPVSVFIYCMTDPELGVEGFYLYCFLKHKCDLFSSFDCSNKRMVQLTGLSLSEIKNQLKNLEQRNMITSDHKPYCLNRPDDKVTKANTYSVNCVSEFANSYIEWNVIPKQVFMDVEQYEMEIGFVEDQHEIKDEIIVIEDKTVNRTTGEIYNDDFIIEGLPEVFAKREKLKVS